MKKFFYFIVTAILMLNISLVSVSAEKPKPINIVVGGTYVPRTGAEAFIEDGRTLVPVRAVAETMRAEVLWDSGTQTITMNKASAKLSYNGKEYPNCTANAKLVIGQKAITIGLIDENGKEVFSVVREMDVSAKIVDGRTFIPARYVGYALGYDVSWEDKEGMASRVLYKLIGKQTIDFDGTSENPVYDPVKRIDYEYNKEKYPDTIVVNDIEYPCRKGYGDIVIVDATRGRFEGTKMINVFPYRWTANNVIIECDDERYKIDESKTIDENLETYSKFYTEKVGEKVVFDYGIYFPEYLTIERVTNFCKRNSENGLLDDGLWGYEYIDSSKTYYSISSAFPVVDITKMYFIDERPYEGYYPGSKQYGWKRNEILSKAHDKNTLMFLNSFLGETGQRIWTMLNDYYTMSGHSYVAPDTEWTKKYTFYDENNNVSFGLPEPIDGIPTDVVEKYGLNVIDNRKVSGGMQLLTLKTDNQVIYLEYACPSILVETGSALYQILFTTIED